MSSNGKASEVLFYGDRNLFPAFEKVVKIDMNNSKHKTNMFNFCFEPYNATGVEVLPTELTVQPVPAAIVVNIPANATAQVARNLRDTKKDNIYAIEKAEKANALLHEINAEATKIINSHVSPEIREALIELSSARLMWRYLNETYGPATRSFFDKEFSFWKVFQIMKGPNQDLSTFIEVVLTNQLNLVEVTPEALKKMLILSTADTNPFGIQLLDDQFMSAVKRLKREDKTLAEIMTVLRNVEQANKAKVGSSGAVSSAKAVRQGNVPNREKICRNCNNSNHFSIECNSDFCAGCHGFRTGHKLDHCPMRNQTCYNNGRNPKKRGFDDHQDLDDGYESNSSRRSQSGSGQTKPALKRSNSPSNKNRGNSGNQKGNKNNRSNSNKANSKRSKPDPAEKNVTFNDDDSDEEPAPRQRNYGKKVRRVATIPMAVSQRRTKICVNRQINSDGSKSFRLFKTPMVLDSGADDNIVNNPTLLEKVHKSNLPTLVTASGDAMQAEGIGKMNNVMDHVIVSRDVVENLASVKQLQQKGLWVIMPPTDGSVDIGKKVGAFMVDNEGVVFGIANRDMIFDADSFGRLDCNYTVELPLITRHREVIPSPPLLLTNGGETTIAHDYEGDIHSRFRLMYGLSPAMTVSDLVLLVHSIAHWSKKEMIFMARGGVANFPLTVNQIKKHFPLTCATCCKGNLKDRQASVDPDPIQEDESDVDTGVKDSKSFDKKMALPQLYDMFKNKRLDPQNLQIGAIVGCDFFGAILKVSTFTCTDKCTGYMHAQAVDKDGKKDASKLVANVFDHYAQYGHHVKEYGQSIDELRCDSDKVLLSKDVEKLCKEHGVKVRASPPEKHQLNGLAENSNQQLLYSCRKAFTQMRHVPEALWPLCWVYQAQCLNLRRSLHEGSEISRAEAFTGIKPDFKKTPFLPFGTVVEFPVYSQPKLAEKTHTGIFVGLSTTVENAIMVYSYATKAIVQRATYRVLLEVPSPWTQISPQYFHMDKYTPEELQALFADPHTVKAVVGEPTASEVSRLDAKYVPLRDVNNNFPLPVLSPANEPWGAQQVAAPGARPLAHSAAPLPATAPTIVQAAAVPAPTPAPNSQEAANAALQPAIIATLPMEPTMEYATNPTAQSSAPIDALSAPRSAVLEVENPQLAEATVDVAVGHEGGIGDSSPVVANAQAPTPMNRAKKKQFRHVQVKHGRLLNPIIEGALLNPDEDLTQQFAINALKLKFQVVRAFGQRTKLLNLDRLQLQKERTKIQKFLRRIVKKRSADNPSLAQAMKRSDWPEFEKAIDAELQQLRETGTYEDVILAQLSKDIKVIGTMWVLTVKRLPNGKIDKYKARLVALGNQQKEDQYGKISSPTARSATVKCLVGIQAKTRGKSCVMDVKGAYLKSHVTDEDLYIRLPDGTVVKLKKYLYGLKQAGRKWNELLSETLIKLGYTQSEYDPSLFFQHFDDGTYVLMCIHVDDFYVVASKRSLMKQLHAKLEEAFGEVSIKSDEILGYLGMQVNTTEEDYISLSQPGYLNKILEKAGIDDDALSDIPYSDKMVEKDGDAEPFDKIEYLELIGMLNYLAVLTRPDILYSLSRCAQRCSNPNRGDYRRVLKIFKYLNKTKDYELRFKREGEIKLTCHVDASHIHYEEDGKGHFGYAFSLGEDDACFYARSQKMKIVTPAGSTESEYVALYEASTEVVFLRNLLEEIGFKQDGPTIVHEDNKSTIHMVNGEGKFHKQKHINVKFHYSRELVKQGVMSVQHCATEEMTADILTKPATKVIQTKLAKKMLGF